MGNTLPRKSVLADGRTSNDFSAFARNVNSNNNNNNGSGSYSRDIPGANGSSFDRNAESKGGVAKNNDTGGDGDGGNGTASDGNNQQNNNNNPFFLLNSPVDQIMTGNNILANGLNDAKVAENKTVPHVFRWSKGGNQVSVTGTFNKWKERIPLTKSREDFTTIINMPLGTHQFKFIVDNEWVYNPDLPTMPDRSGAVNNFVEIDDQDDGFDFEDFVTALSNSDEVEGDQYGQDVPKLDSATKPPPTLPPHLMQVLLNCDPVSPNDPSLLPIPNHVMLNHLYALSISDGVMVLGMTSRYQKKYVTTILYHPVFEDESILPPPPANNNPNPNATAATDVSNLFGNSTPAAESVSKTDTTNTSAAAQPKSSDVTVNVVPRASSSDENNKKNLTPHPSTTDKNIDNNITCNTTGNYNNDAYNEKQDVGSTVSKTIEKVVTGEPPRTRKKVNETNRLT